MPGFEISIARPKKPTKRWIKKNRLGLATIRARVVENAVNELMTLGASMSKDSIEEVELGMSSEAAARIAALPTLRLPTDVEIDWLCTLLTLGKQPERNLHESVKEILNGLVEQGMAAQITDANMIFRNSPSAYAATVKGMAFFTGLYDTESLRKAMEIHKEKGSAAYTIKEA